MNLIHGDALTSLKTLPSSSVQTCVTSPPYWSLRDYEIDGQIGLEDDPFQFIEKLVEVFREVRRVLKPDGTMWIVIGDTYAGSWSSQRRRRSGSSATPKGLKPKDLIGIPWRLAFALQADGWWLRRDVIWNKENAIPESVGDRPVTSHEYVFLFSKSRRYFYDGDAIREPYRKTSVDRMNRNYTDQNGRLESRQPGRTYHVTGAAVPQTYKANPLGRPKRSVWTVSTKAFRGAHFATFPVDLVEPCILAGSRAGDTVLDPFIGAGSTAVAAARNGRECVGIDLNPDYLEIARQRVATEAAQMRLR